MAPHAGSRQNWGWRRVGRRAYRLFSLPAEDQRLLIEAAALLLVARAFVALLPFRYVARLMGRAASPTAAPLELPQLRQVRRVGWAIEATALRIPIVMRCLPRAVAAKMMLRRRGVPSLLHLGAQLRDENLQAHAWLVAGSLTVTGASEANAFREIATFE